MVVVGCDVVVVGCEVVVVDTELVVVGCDVVVVDTELVVVGCEVVVVDTELVVVGCEVVVVGCDVVVVGCEVVVVGITLEVVVDIEVVVTGGAVVVVIGIVVVEDEVGASIQSFGSPDCGCCETIAQASEMGTQSKSELQVVPLWSHVPLLQNSPGMKSLISIKHMTNVSSVRQSNPLQPLGSRG